MTDEPLPETGRLQLAAALLASSVIGAPLVIGTAVQTILLTLNPRGIDVRQPSAYEFEVGAAFLAAIAGAVVAVVLVFSRLKARADARAVLRVPYLILALQTAFAVVALALFIVAPGI